MSRSCFDAMPFGTACAVLTAMLTLPAAAAADEYVLTAANWGSRQDAAVAAAGGAVVWSHARAGLALVSSDAPGFLEAARTSRAFQAVERDVSIRWTPDIGEQAIDPDAEAFFPLQWHLEAVEAPAAWDAGCTGDGARVAVLDGGIYDIHPDLEPNIDKPCSVSFVPGQAYNTDTGTFWHGTHVAGIVAAANVGFGVLGVAPEATVMGVKVLHGGSGTFGQIIGGILYAADPAAFGADACARADIINMSLGALVPKQADGAGRLVGAMAQAVNFAASRGVLVVSAAGNDGLDMRDVPALASLPSDSGSGLSISATGPLGFALGASDFRRPASYSNFGNGAITLAGPGGDFALPGEDLCIVGGVVQLCWVFDMVFSTCRGPADPPQFSFCWAAGTSMAAPAVSGVAALIKGANPGIPLGQLKARLRQTADDEGKPGHDAFYGHGFVNARRACTD